MNFILLGRDRPSLHQNVSHVTFVVLFGGEFGIASFVFSALRASSPQPMHPTILCSTSSICACSRLLVTFLHFGADKQIACRLFGPEKVPMEERNDRPSTTRKLIIRSFKMCRPRIGPSDRVLLAQTVPKSLESRLASFKPCPLRVRRGGYNNVARHVCGSLDGLILLGGRQRLIATPMPPYREFDSVNIAGADRTSLTNRDAVTRNGKVG